MKEMKKRYRTEDNKINSRFYLMYRIKMFLRGLIRWW